MQSAADPSRASRVRAYAASPWLRALAVAAAVLVVDQLSKHLVRDSIARGEERRFLPGIQLVDTRNHGVAFGILPGQQTLVTVLIGVANAPDGLRAGARRCSRMWNSGTDARATRSR